MRLSQVVDCEFGVVLDGGEGLVSEKLPDVVEAGVGAYHLSGAGAEEIRRSIAGMVIRGGGLATHVLLGAGRLSSGSFKKSSKKNRNLSSRRRDGNHCVES